jgi:hypothetical protein
MDRGEVVMRDQRTMRRSAAALAACLVLAGCAAKNVPEAAPPDVAVHTSPPSRAPATPENEVYTNPRLGPKTAEVGVSYPFDLYTHCGVQFAAFGGQTWKVVQPVADPEGTPFARGAINYLPGTATLIDASTLRFVVADNSRTIPGEVVTFHPTSEPMPLCD